MITNAQIKYQEWLYWISLNKALLDALPIIEYVKPTLRESLGSRFGGRWSIEKSPRA